MRLLILCHVVVTVLAFRTFQSNSCAHNFHLAFNIFTYVLLMVASHQFLGIKKKPTSIRPNIVSYPGLKSKPFPILFSRKFIYLNTLSVTAKLFIAIPCTRYFPDSLYEADSFRLYKRIRHSSANFHPPFRSYCQL